MDKYFDGLPYEKVMIGDTECYKSADGCFYRIDEGNTFVAIEVAENEEGVRCRDFEDVDLYDKDSKDAGMVATIRSALNDLTQYQEVKVK